MEKERQVGLRLATWNIGTMSGKDGHLARALMKRKVDIVCVQETRLKENGCEKIAGDRFKFYWSGCGDEASGVGIIIKQELENKVLNVNRINDRLGAGLS